LGKVAHSMFAGACAGGMADLDDAALLKWRTHNG
jgi:hypothetical protein